MHVYFYITINQLEATIQLKSFNLTIYYLFLVPFTVHVYSPWVELIVYVARLNSYFLSTSPHRPSLDPLLLEKRLSPSHTDPNISFFSVGL